MLLMSLALATLGLLQATHLKHTFANNALAAMQALQQQVNTANITSTLPVNVTQAASPTPAFGLGAPVQSPSFGALPLGLAGVGYVQSYLPNTGFGQGSPSTSASLEASILHNGMMAQAAALMQQSIMERFHQQEMQKRANIASGLSLWG
jgi:hypothetical protein